MNKVAILSTKERQELFRETASKDGRFNPVTVEKDFWVCWILKILFGIPELKKSLVFKGGTSLSKAYNAIERFSEDIDISIAREYFGFIGEKDPANPDISGKARKKLINELLPKIVKDYICGQLKDELENGIKSILKDNSDWKVEIDPNDGASQTLLFWYPASIDTPQGYNYVKQFVRLELGVRSDQWPSETVEITPYAAEQFPKQFDQATCKVNCLSIKRTFWEKVTLLHSLYHKKEGVPLPERCSRHYYDTYRLLKLKDKLGIDTEDMELLTAVREHKNIFFKSSWASYDTAVPGKLRLVPPEYRLSELAEDYRLTLRDMLYGERLTLDEIITTLAEFELMFNKI